MQSQHTGPGLWPISVALVLGVCGIAHAVATNAQQCRTFGFTGLTGLTPDVITGHRQFFLDVLNGPLPGEATFQFRNVGATGSSITTIFLDDRGIGGREGTPVLASLGTFFSSAGTLFAQPENALPFPGANALFPPFQSREQFTLVASSPTNGINPGESLRVTASLEPDKTIQNVRDAIQTGQLLVGLQAGEFASGVPASFVNDMACVPSPGAVLLSSLGAGLVGLLRWRRML